MRSNIALKLSFCLGLLLSLSAAALEPACQTCGKKVYGTSIEWLKTPSAAANLAKKQEKLVFVLHVSGHFEDPAFT